MENLGDDLNFPGGDIDPNQLGFPSVTEPSYITPSTSAHNILRHMDNREAAPATGQQILDIPYTSGTVNLQEYAHTHMPALDSEGLHTFFHRSDDNQMEIAQDLLNDPSKSLSYIQPAAAYNSSTTADTRQTQYSDALAMQPLPAYSQPSVATSLPSLAGLLPFPNKVSSNNYVESNNYQNPSANTTFRSATYLPETSASSSSALEPNKNMQNGDFLESFSNIQRHNNNSIISRTLSSILLPGLTQNPELFNQLSLQLQNQGLSTSQVVSMFSSVGSAKGLQESTNEISVGPANLPSSSGNLNNMYAMHVPDRPASSLSNQSQEIEAPVEASTSNEERARNEPEMMIYHDKMTRKNILVPIGPPNVSAGRNMAPSPMFLEDTPRHIIQSPQVTEASSSADPLRSNVNVSEFLNLPSRPIIPREATPAPCQNATVSQPDSPSDNYVSSTTREDLPPLREILPRHNDISLMEQRERFHLLTSSFHAAPSASSNDVITFNGHDDSTAASGMLSLPEYEPISDSEDGEISSSCVIPPSQSYPQEEEEEEEDEECTEEEEEEEEDPNQASLQPVSALPQLHESMISQQLPSTLVTPSRASFAAEVSTPQLSNLISTAAAIAPAASNYHAESPSQEEFLKVEQAPSHDLKTLSPLSFPTEPPPPPTPKEDTPIDDAAATFREPEEPDAADSATQKLEINLQIDDNQFVMENGTKKWTCLQCPKTYSSKHNLITHVLGHSGIKPHCCLMCGKFFKQQSHLHTHMLTHGNVKPHACKICQRSFTQASHMKRHMAVHMQKRPHICSVCERGFVYPCELKIHMAKHKNGKANVCADCDESFSSLKKLRLHMQVAHKDQTSLTCPECGKSFTYPSQLKDHMLKHEGKRPYICSECGMDFVKEHHLKAHAFTHTGLRPFVCLVCDRAFNQKANLLRHMVVHDEQRKFECNTCHRTFTQAQVLRAHMVTHAEKKPHTCKKCGKGFSRLHNLNGHMHMHGGEKPHTCFCGASFTLKGNLNRHKKEKHNISAGSEISTEEEAAFILNEMSAGRRSRVNSEDHERHDLSPKKLKTVETSEDQHTSTTDLSSIDLITRFVSLNDDAGSRANGEAASGSSLATIGLREEHSERPSTRKGGRVGRRSNPLLSVIPPPIIVSQVNNADTASRAKTKADIVLPPKRRVSEIEKETGLL